MIKHDVSGSQDPQGLVTVVADSEEEPEEPEEEKLEEQWKQTANSDLNSKETVPYRICTVTVSFLLQLWYIYHNSNLELEYCFVIYLFVLCLVLLQKQP